ncbi:MAG: 3-methyl-2-oxobutanoate dehydrogenase subunit alpha [Ktedonobacteraceae bacterium]
MEINFPSLSVTFIQDLYTRMLLARLVDIYACRLHKQGQHSFFATYRNHEAAQVGSAVCIEVGKDFTLPYYRDLGVVLTIGMTPYEIFRTYLQAQHSLTGEGSKQKDSEHTNPKNNQSLQHWGYHKHNTVTGSSPIATQVLHAAGIAFASKLRKAPVVTVAYCGDDALFEPDFLEGITFAARHQLPAVFVYEQDSPSSLSQILTLPANLEYTCIDGTDIISVYATMQAAMHHAREGNGPVLLEMKVSPYHEADELLSQHAERTVDPLVRCQSYLEKINMWDAQWAMQLHARLSQDVEQALQDALRDIS